ncbi:hypothetical protein PGH45_04480 [Legionella pneumophila]|nr:hypothetical protein [Legionella pneumophila]
MIVDNFSCLHGKNPIQETD